MLRGKRADCINSDPTTSEASGSRQPDSFLSVGHSHQSQWRVPLSAGLECPKVRLRALSCSASLSRSSARDGFCPDWIDRDE